MTLSRFSLAFLIAYLPTLAFGAAPTIQDANQAFRIGNNQAALEKVNGFLKSNPKDAQGRFLKGLVLTELNRHNEAIKVFTSLTEDYPELPEPYNNLAVLHAAQADYERAKHSLEMAIRTHPSYATAHENLGDIYAKMASQAYDKALQLDKSNTSAQTKLSLIRDLFGPPPQQPEAIKTAEAESSKPTGKPSGKPAAPVTAATQKPDAKEVKPVATGPSTQPSAQPSAQTARAEAIEPKAQVERVIRSWVEAWSARDAAAYLAFYSDKFKTPNGVEFAAWAEDRKLRVTRPEYINVSIDHLKIKTKGNSAQVSFNQRYESNIVKDSSNKTLTLLREGTTWKITQER